MKLNNINDKVWFEDVTHSYFFGERELMGVTSLMKKHGLSKIYEEDKVPERVKEQYRIATENGTKVHKALEEYNNNPKKLKVYELLPEVQKFRKLKLKVIASEYLISDFDIVASSIDAVEQLKDGVALIDYKTTSTLHVEEVTWQLSIYAYLFEQLNPDVKVKAIKAIHFHNDEVKVVELDRLPSEKVIALLNAEKDGKIYTQLPEIATESGIRNIYDLQVFISNLEAEAKMAKQKLDSLKEQIYKAMDENNIKQIDNELMKITRVLPTIRQSVDSKLLESTYPDIYKAVLKEVPIKGNIKITLK